MYHAGAQVPIWVSVTPHHPTASVADRSSCRTTVSTNCDTSYNYNQGCGTQVTHPRSYGRDFNSGRGGFYALARSKEYGVKVWFWSRRSLFVPFDVRENREVVDPDHWGQPTAYFPTGDNCGYEEHFNAHMFIFDLTFCVRSFPHSARRGSYLLCGSQGDWAGSPTVWPQSGCSPMSCNDCELRRCRYVGRCTDVDTSPVVDQNPGAFVDAYWEVNSLRVYTPEVN